MAKEAEPAGDSGRGGILPGLWLSARRPRPGAGGGIPLPRRQQRLVLLQPARSWQFNPSAGLLLKFTGDVVTLVLIRGSNLDALVKDGAINLTDRGFQRHRIIWVREMDEEELRKVGERASRPSTASRSGNSRQTRRRWNG